MNTKLIFSAIGFVVGAIAGGFVTYIYTKRKDEAEFQEMSDRYEHEISMLTKKPVIRDTKEDEKPKDDISDGEVALNTHKIDYTTFYQEAIASESSDELPSLGDKHDHESPQDEDIFMITKDQYLNGPECMDNVETLMYYIDENMLFMDAMGGAEYVEKPEVLIGNADFLDAFKVEDPPEAIYIRNCLTETDYEVFLEYGPIPSTYEIYGEGDD